jgi:hypothetical protein
MKGFNEAMCTQIYVYFLIFPIRFLQKDIIDIKYVDSVTPKLSHWIIGVFHSITELDPSFFSTGFLEDNTCEFGINCPRGAVKNQIIAYLITRMNSGGSTTTVE